MDVSKATIVSVVLLSLTAGAMLPPLFQVAVTNFPLDTEGNIRVTSMNGEPQDPSWKVISVVEDYNLTWTPELSDRWVYSEEVDLGSVEVGGYSRMKVYMRITNYTILYQGFPNAALVDCLVYSVYDYGEVYRDKFDESWDWQDTKPRSRFIDYPYRDMRETLEPTIRITMRGGSSTPNGPVLPRISCLVSIGICLRND